MDETKLLRELQQLFETDKAKREAEAERDGAIASHQQAVDSGVASVRAAETAATAANEAAFRVRASAEEKAKSLGDKTTAQLQYLIDQLQGKTDGEDPTPDHAAPPASDTGNPVG